MNICDYIYVYKYVLMSGKAGTFHSAKEVYIECCVPNIYIYIIPYTAKAFFSGMQHLETKANSGNKY